MTLDNPLLFCHKFYALSVSYPFYTHNNQKGSHMDQPVQSPEENKKIAFSDKRLDSWKEIARFLNRDVRTVMRWGKRVFDTLLKMDILAVFVHWYIPENLNHPKIYWFQIFFLRTSLCPCAILLLSTEDREVCRQLLHQASPLLVFPFRVNRMLI